MSSFSGGKLGDIHFQGYIPVQTSGLPYESGKYFLITSDDQLLLAELELIDDTRLWNCYPTGETVNESRIRMWKRIPG